MKFNLFTTSIKSPLSISFEHYNSESNRLVIYNTSSHSINSADISLINSDNKKFLFKNRKLGQKSGNLIDYGHHPDENGKFFTGILNQVTIDYADHHLKFLVEKEKIFKLLK